MSIFENPNSPTQPKEGVYTWYAEKDSKSPIAIYIGQAGYKAGHKISHSPEDTPRLPKGTLSRGVSELQRNTFSSNAPIYDRLDTDFVVGTALKFFEEKLKYRCIWRHIDNVPKKETDIVKEKPTLLQNHDAKIHHDFKIKRDRGYWKLTGLSADEKSLKIKEAEDAVFDQLLKFIAAHPEKLI